MAKQRVLQGRDRFECCLSTCSSLRLPFHLFCPGSRRRHRGILQMQMWIGGAGWDWHLGSRFLGVRHGCFCWPYCKHTRWNGGMSSYLLFTGIHGREGVCQKRNCVSGDRQKVMARQANSYNAKQPTAIASHFSDRQRESRLTESTLDGPS